MDDTTDVDFVWSEYIPLGATQMVLITNVHATTTPGAGTQVRLHLQCRDRDGSDAWSADQDLTLIDIPESEAYVKDELAAVTLSNLSCTAGEFAQFGLSRDPDDGSDDLTDDLEYGDFVVRWE